tara:strand:+ start:252 stop:590 length:339 start_codon:yes stop_codon:yes gene_type:complete
MNNADNFDEDKYAEEFEDEALVLSAIDQAGGSRQGTIGIGYRELTKLIGFEENVADDPYKVEASWGFEDQYGRQGFVWCYKTGKLRCGSWSCDGDPDLLSELFGRRYYKSKY